MKVAFDENVPIAMVRVFQTFANETQIRKLTGGLVVESAADHTPTPGDADYLPKNDVPWIRRFAASGGTVIISGNTRMQSVYHERLALVQAGMVVVFFESRWNNLKFWTKCAILLHWWPEVVTTIKKAPAPSFWRIPSTLDLKGKLVRLSHEDEAKLKMEKQIAAGPKKAAERKARRSTPLAGQSSLDLKGGAMKAKKK